MVYKRHKAEFYDACKKEWSKSHVSLDQHMNELDAADDEEICNVLASSHKGDLCTIVPFIPIVTNVVITPVCFVRVLKSYFLDINFRYCRISKIMLGHH